MQHIESRKCLPSYQSAYRKNHGVETAMLKMYNDLLLAADNEKVFMVVMIDLSAAFDTVNIDITLRLLEQNFGICGTPLSWIKSYLQNRTMAVSIDN